MSKQTLLNQGGKWFDLAQLGAAPASPAAGTNRLYVDANGLLQFTSPAGSQPSRRLVTDWGVGTAFPATGLGRGDVYTHSGIGCMFLWNGASWRQATPIVAGTLAILTTTGTTYGALLHDGVEAYVTGVKTPYRWDTATSAWIGTGATPRVTVRRSTAQPIPGTAGAVIAFDSTSTRSTAGMWSAVNPTRLVVPEAGEYDLATHLPWAVSASAGGISSQFRINGATPAGLISPYLDGRPSNAWYGSEQSAIIRGLELAAGDYVEVFALQNSDTNRNVSAGAWATLELARR